MSRTDDVSVHSNGDYWQASYYDLDGRRRRVNLGPKDSMTKAAARREANQLAAQFIAKPNTRTSVRTMTLEQFRPEYFRLRANDLKDGTALLHGYTFDRLCGYFGGGAKLDRITAYAAAGWRAWLCDQPSKRGKPGPDKEKLSNLSVSRHIRDAKVVFNFAVQLGLCKSNPFEHVKPGAVHVAKEWHKVSREDLRKIMAAGSGDWPVLFALARLAGMRRGEILRLTWADVDWHAKMIHVLPELQRGARAEGTKQRERWVPIDPELYKILQDHFDAVPDETVPVCRIPTNNMHVRALAILRRAGLPGYSKPIHTLKKCLASEWLERGIPVTDVAKWLGDSVEVLMKHYVEAMKSSAARVTGDRDELAELRAERARLEAEIRAMKEAKK